MKTSLFTINSSINHHSLCVEHEKMREKHTHTPSRAMNAKARQKDVTYFKSKSFQTIKVSQVGNNTKLMSCVWNQVIYSIAL